MVRKADDGLFLILRADACSLTPATLHTNPNFSKTAGNQFVLETLRPRHPPFCLSPKFPIDQVEKGPGHTSIFFFPPVLRIIGFGSACFVPPPNNNINQHLSTVCAEINEFVAALNLSQPIMFFFESWTECCPLSAEQKAS